MLTVLVQKYKSRYPTCTDLNFSHGDFDHKNNRYFELETISERKIGGYIKGNFFCSFVHTTNIENVLCYSLSWFLGILKHLFIQHSGDIYWTSTYAWYYVNVLKMSMTQTLP